MVTPKSSSRLPTVVDGVQIVDAEFRIPASDQQGHSERGWFRLQPGHHRQVEVIVASRQFPYRTSGDLFRHAIIRHLKWLDEIGETPVQSNTKQVDAVVRLIQEEEFQQDFDQLFIKLDKVVSVHMREGRLDSAIRLIGDIRGHVLDMPGGEWQDRYLEEIEKRYGHIR